MKRSCGFITSMISKSNSDFSSMVAVLWIYPIKVGFSSIFQSGLSRETGWHFSLGLFLFFLTSFSSVTTLQNNTLENNREAAFVKCHDHKQSEWLLLHLSYINVPCHQLPLETTQVHEVKQDLLLEWVVLTTFLQSLVFAVELELS